MQVNRTRMLRVRAVAEMFDVHVATIYRAIESGQLEALKIGTGKAAALRIPESAVHAYAKACAEAARRTAETVAKSDPNADTTGEAA